MGGGEQRPAGGRGPAYEPRAGDGEGEYEIPDAGSGAGPGVEAGDVEGEDVDGGRQVELARFGAGDPARLASRAVAGPGDVGERVGRGGRGAVGAVSVLGVVGATQAAGAVDEETMMDEAVIEVLRRVHEEVLEDEEADAGR